MPPMTRIAGALAAAALLGGCASGEGEWTKPGADEADGSAGVSVLSLNWPKTRVGPEIGINQDILATRGTDWQRSQVRNSADPHDDREYTRPRRRDRRVLHERQRLSARALRQGPCCAGSPHNQEYPWPGLTRGPSAHGLDPWASASSSSKTRLAGDA